MGWFSKLKKKLKVIKLPNIKLPSLSTIGSSGLGKFVGDAVKTVGEIAGENAPALMSFASTFVPAGGLMSTLLKGGSQMMGGTDPNIVNPAEDPPTLQQAIPKKPLPPETVKILKSVPTSTYKQVSDVLATKKQKDKAAYWNLMQSKFAAKGIQIVRDEDTPSPL
jgi:hypothetical protein